MRLCPSAYKFYHLLLKRKGRLNKMRTKHETFSDFLDEKSPDWLEMLQLRGLAEGRNFLLWGHPLLWFESQTFCFAMEVADAQTLYIKFAWKL